MSVGTAWVSPCPRSMQPAQSLSQGGAVTTGGCGGRTDAMGLLGPSMGGTARARGCRWNVLTRWASRELADAALGANAGADGGHSRPTLRK